jgi:hypothetical protein
LCDGALRVHRSSPVPDSDPTGALWTHERAVCERCGCELAHDVIFQVGRARERWGFERLPGEAPAREGTARERSLFCPACDAALVAAWPAQAGVEPATGVVARPSMNERENEHVCLACSGRYVLLERVESTWSRLERDGPHASLVPTEPPRPFRRRG